MKTIMDAILNAMMKAPQDLMIRWNVATAKNIRYSHRMLAVTRSDQTHSSEIKASEYGNAYIESFTKVIAREYTIPKA